MRVLVCGSRFFNDDDWFYEVLNVINDTYNNHNKISLIIEGGATGADSLARQFAETFHIEVKTFPAYWNEFGKSAGPIRNQQMLDEGKPDLVIAFLAEGSKGTKDMIDRATKSNIATKVINI